MIDEKLLERVQGLLAFMTEADACDHLVSEGMSSGIAFLAVKGAQMAPTLPIKKAREVRCG
jgi:hypothetical protein